MKKTKLLLSLFLIIPLLSMAVQKNVFVENKGQLLSVENKLRNDVLYYYQNKNCNVYIGKDFIQYSLKIKTNTNKEELRGKEILTNVQWASFSAHLENSNQNPSITTNKKRDFYENYYLAHCPQGITNVFSYEEIIIKNVYQGIDWKIYIDENGIKYDFIVNPGANPKDIIISYKNAENVSLSAEGKLKISNSIGFIEEDKPISYTQSGKSVASSFQLKSGKIKFDLENYSQNEVLVIDPGIVWGTYFGGSDGEDIASNVVYGAGGALYTTGRSGSSDLAPGAYTHQGTYAGNWDMFLAKFNSNGTLNWCTYLGGNDEDQSNDCAITINGPEKICIVGKTKSADFPTLNPIDGPLQNVMDGALATFDQNGLLLFSSFFGGPGEEDNIANVAYDALGNIYFGGITSDAGFPDGQGGLTTSFGYFDAFAAGVSNTNTLLWCKQYGGQWAEVIEAIGVSEPGDTLYVAGNTNSGDFPSTFPGNNLNGAGDGFVMKLNKSNGSVLMSRLFGGTGDEYVSDMAFFKDGDPGASQNHFIVSGNSSSSDNWIGGTPPNGSNDGYVIRFDINSLQTLGGIFVGGPGDDIIKSCVIKGNKVYYAGRTSSIINITTTNAYQQGLAGQDEGFFGRRDWYQATPDYASYYGGVGVDEINGIDVDDNDIVAMVGYTNSPSGIATPGTHQPTSIDNNDSFLARFASDCNTTPNPITITSSTGSFEFCDGGSITLNAGGGQNYNWSGGISGNSLIVNGSGIYTVTATAFGCSFNTSVTVTENPNPVVTVSPSGAQYICLGDAFEFQASSSTAISWQWFNSGVPISGANTNTVTVSQPGNITVEVVNAQGCQTESFPVQLFVNTPPPAFITAAVTEVCQGDFALITANNVAASYQWYINGNVISGATSNSYLAGTTGVYTVRETYPNTCDSLSNPIAITVYPYPTANATYTGTPYTCTGGTVSMTETGAGNNYTYQWLLNGAAINGETANAYTANSGGDYQVVVTNQGICADTSNTIAVNPPPPVPDLCLVTTDTTGNFNTIIWDKTLYQNVVDSFIVYRYCVATTGYVRIGAVPYDSLSLFNDLDTSICGPNGGNPQYSAQRYKLATRNICGVLSNPGPFHQSIFYQQSGQNFNWNAYNVENGITIIDYNFMRDDNGTNNWQLLQGVSSLNATDPNYLSYPNANYRIEALGFNCEATRAVNTTRSNIKNNQLLPTLLNNNYINEFAIFPNPANESITIKNEGFVLNQNTTVSIYDMLGALIYNEQMTSNLMMVNIQTYAKGVYTIEIEASESRLYKKLIVE